MKNLFDNKRFIYGTYSTLTAIVVIGIAVVINIIAGSINYKRDFTLNSIYSVTDKTKEVLNEIEDDVTVYALYQTGGEDDSVMQVLDQYENACSKIKIRNVDPYLNPKFAEKYADGGSISTGSLIVECGDVYKVVESGKFIGVQTNSETNEQEQVLNVEAQVTGAIKYVTAKEHPVIYNVTGHDEIGLESLGSALKDNLETSNYTLKDINLFEENIPEDCAMLFISTPQKDYTADEAQKVREYLAESGRAIVMIDNIGIKLDNLYKVLEYYGVSFSQDFIIEQNSSNMYNSMPYCILPNINENDKVEGIGSSKVLMLSPYAINSSVDKRGSVTVTPLLSTSKESFAKAGTMTDPNSSVSKEAGDISGPFNTAVAVEDVYDIGSEKNKTRLVVCSAYAYMLYNDYDSAVNYGNSEYIVNCVDWLTESSGGSVYVSPKTISEPTYYIDFGTSQRIKYICVIMLPLFIIGVGVIVWLFRRNR